MPGAHTSLTSTELSRAIDAAAYLCGLESYMDRATFTKIEMLQGDLTIEREDRQRMDTDARRAAMERAVS